MFGQGYSETLPSRDRNTQISVLDLEPVAGEEMLSKGVWGPGGEASSDRLPPSREYSCGARYRAELVVAWRIVLGELVVR